MEPVKPQFIQKRRDADLRKVILELTFDNENLTYTHSDSSGEKTLIIPYESINIETREIIVVKNSLPPAFIVLGFIASVMFILPGLIAIGLEPGAAFIVLIAVMIGTVVGYAKFSNKIKYAVFETGAGRVLIMRDQQYDEIVGQLKAHWIARMRMLHGTVDVSNDPEKETEKFKWLKKKEVISEQEYQDAVGKLEKTKDILKPLPGEKPLN